MAAVRGPWADFVESSGYDAMDSAAKKAARKTFYDTNVLPKLGDITPEEEAKVRLRFALTTAPIDEVTKTATFNNLSVDEKRNIIRDNLIKNGAAAPEEFGYDEFDTPIQGGLMEGSVDTTRRARKGESRVDEILSSFNSQPAQAAEISDARVEGVLQPLRRTGAGLRAIFAPGEETDKDIQYVQEKGKQQEDVVRRSGDTVAGAAPLATEIATAVASGGALGAATKALPVVGRVGAWLAETRFASQLPEAASLAAQRAGTIAGQVVGGATQGALQGDNPGTDTGSYRGGMLKNAAEGAALGAGIASVPAAFEASRAVSRRTKQLAGSESEIERQAALDFAKREAAAGRDLPTTLNVEDGDIVNLLGRSDDESVRYAASMAGRDNVDDLLRSNETAIADNLKGEARDVSRDARTEALQPGRKDIAEVLRPRVQGFRDKVDQDYQTTVRIADADMGESILDANNAVGETVANSGREGASKELGDMLGQRTAQRRAERTGLYQDSVGSATTTGALGDAAEVGTKGDVVNVFKNVRANMDTAGKGPLFDEAMRQYGGTINRTFLTNAAEEASGPLTFAQAKIVQDQIRGAMSKAADAGDNQSRDVLMELRRRMDSYMNDVNAKLSPQLQQGSAELAEANKRFFEEGRPTVFQKGANKFDTAKDYLRPNEIFKPTEAAQNVADIIRYEPDMKPAVGKALLQHLASKSNKNPKRYSQLVEQYGDAIDNAGIREIVDARVEAIRQATDTAERMKAVKSTNLEKVRRGAEEVRQQSKPELDSMLKSIDRQIDTIDKVANDGFDGVVNGRMDNSGVKALQDAMRKTDAAGKRDLEDALVTSVVSRGIDDIASGRVKQVRLYSEEGLRNMRKLLPADRVAKLEQAQKDIQQLATADFRAKGINSGIVQEFKEKVGSASKLAVLQLLNPSQANNLFTLIIPGFKSASTGFGKNLLEDEAAMRQFIEKLPDYKAQRLNEINLVSKLMQTVSGPTRATLQANGNEKGRTERSEEINTEARMPLTPKR